MACRGASHKRVSFGEKNMSSKRYPRNSGHMVRAFKYEMSLPSLKRERQIVTKFNPEAFMYKILQQKVSLMVIRKRPGCFLGCWLSGGARGNRQGLEFIEN
jgi:hypothetical protein